MPKFQSENGNFRTNFDRIFSKFQSPYSYWTPKQSLGQILDKFGVSGVFEGCKGKKGSQIKGRGMANGGGAKGEKKPKRNKKKIKGIC